MNDDRPAGADAEPTPVNSQVTDSVETSTHTKLGAIPSSYGEAGGMGTEADPTDGEPQGGG